MGQIREAGSGTARSARLLCFGAAGFTSDALAEAATDEAVQLIDLERLYHGE